MIVLDTSVVSAIMRREDAAQRRLARIAPESVVLTSPVAAEIRYGLQRLVPGSRRRVQLERAYELLRTTSSWANWNEDAATLFGVHKALLEARGQVIGDMDVAIGSIALALGAAVATYNVAHFGGIDGLAIDEWSL